MRVTGVYTSVAVALVTLAALCYTVVRCPGCRRRVMDVPGSPNIEVREFRENPSGRGRTLVCPRCKSSIEVIEHG